VARYKAPRGERKRVRSGFLIVWTWSWGAVTLATMAMAVPQWIDRVPNSDGPMLLILFTGTLTVGGWLTLSRWFDGPAPPPVRRPELSSVLSPGGLERYWLPRAKSAAWRPMRRLGEAELALAELLRQARDAAVPADVVEQAWDTAADTAERLRAAAKKLDAVERAAEQLLPPERETLEDGAHPLRAYLAEGLDGYRALLAAAGRVVLASASTPADDELVEAAEKLAAFAQALGELTPPEA